MNKEDIKILIVDDEEHTRLGYGEVLKLSGYNVEIAEDGKAGLYLAEKEDFDLIITDLRMPKMGGLEFIEKLREFNPSVKVVVITAFGSFKTYQKSNQLGVIKYLNKPVRAKDLKEAVEELIK
jgi:two-component system response regulator (stage 0 sporulation protein F)